MESGAMQRRIKVVFAIDNLHIGGTELNAVRLAERLDRSRFELRVVSLQADGPLAERYRQAGVPRDVFSPGTFTGRRMITEGLRLRAYLQRHHVEVFHAHDLYSNLFGCPWARLAGVKVIASRRWAGAMAGRFGKIASRMPYRISHVALANSPRVAEMLERVDGVPRRRVAIVPNFVDEDAFTPMSDHARRALVRELGIANASAVIGVVANLRPVKDHETLIRAIALLRPKRPGLRVVLVGEGESRPVLERLATALDVREQVIFAGSRSNQPNLNELFDVAVLCSKREGLPNSILEAMAAGTPVVATDVGAVADAVIERETGLLVPPSDPHELAAALEVLLADRARAREMGAVGRERAQALYSPEAALRALESVYFGLVHRRPSGNREPAIGSIPVAGSHFPVRHP